jgi:hypothetical protein
VALLQAHWTLLHSIFLLLNRKNSCHSSVIKIVKLRRVEK